VDLEDGLDAIKDSTLASSPTTTPAQLDAHHSHSHHHHEEAGHHGGIDESALAQILGVAILEFGVIFHSFIIGLTLAVNAEFVPLFCVLIL
jgi:zinc transporter 1/2/3